MSIDRRHIGYCHPAFIVTVERERMVAFARAIGEIATDDVAPLTFMKVLEGEGDSSRAIVGALGVELKRVLHAEQQFDYLSPIHAGDRLRVERRVTDIYDKKAGAMQFVVIESQLSRLSGECVGRSRQVLLIRTTSNAVNA